MSRSHPPTLLTLARRLVADEGLVHPGDRVVVACSGGPDSSALLHVLACLRAPLGVELHAVGVDHGLREGASAELDLAAEVADREAVPFARVEVAVAPGGDLQARARVARHRALQAVAEEVGAAVVALGHTADDRAETVLMRIMRGAGPRGVAAMPARSGGVEGDVPLVRPLLRARRADVEAHLSRHGVRAAEDPSNAERRFLRARVRHEILPLLADSSPNIVAHLCALADDLDDAREDPWADLSRAQRRMLRRAVAARRSGTTVRLSGSTDLELRFFRRSADTGGKP